MLGKIGPKFSTCLKRRCFGKLTQYFCLPIVPNHAAMSLKNP